jgi:hypothetical protein
MSFLARYNLKNKIMKYSHRVTDILQKWARQKILNFNQIARGCYDINLLHTHSKYLEILQLLQSKYRNENSLQKRA